MLDLKKLRRIHLFDARRFWVNDYDTCEDADSLVKMLNTIVNLKYQLTCVIPAPPGYVVVFRRPPNG